MLLFHVPQDDEAREGRWRYSAWRFRSWRMGVDIADVLREFAKIPEWREMGVLLPLGYAPRAFLPTDPAVWNPHYP